VVVSVRIAGRLACLALLAGCPPKTDEADVDPDPTVDPETTEDPETTDDPTDPTDEGLPVLGNGSHDVSGAIVTVGNAGDGLDRPKDLAFNPAVEGELWVVSHDDDSATIYDDAGGPGQQSTHIVDPYALHFMEQVSSIAMGPNGYFGTCQDSRNTYNGQGEPNTFMGPTLWSSDREIFGFSNPEAVEELSEEFGFYVDLGSHLDMLHESPNCMGIAWEEANVYWVFDGWHGSINRYDFQEDHGVGYDDHSDGIIGRWVEGEVDRVAGIVSHLVLDHETGLLYIADTGNNRIAVLDTKTGQRGDSLPTMEFGTDHHEWVNASLTTLVEGEPLGMVSPAGIELVEGVLLVTDAGTGRLHAFDLDGYEIDWAETGRTEGLSGIFARSLTDVWLLDGKKDELLRLNVDASVAR
jgi:hypothetical protein